MGVTREEIRVEANTAPLNTGLARGEQRMKQFQDKVGQISSQISTLTAITTGFGILAAGQQIISLVDRVEQRLEGLQDAALMRRVRGMGAIAGGRAEQIAQLAQRAPRAPSFVEFGLLGAVIEGGALKIGEFVTSLKGTNEASESLRLAFEELRTATLEQVNEAGSAREGLALLAAQLAEAESIARGATLGGAEARLGRAGFTSEDILAFREAVQSLKELTPRNVIRLEEEFLKAHEGSETAIAIAFD